MNMTLCAWCEHGVVREEERPPILKELLGYCLLMDREVGAVRNCTAFLEHDPDREDEDES